MILDIIEKYLELYPNEEEQIIPLIEYLGNHSYEEAVDWNNFDGHIVAGGFIYSKKDKKFLMVYHKDLDMYLYPGGHMNKNDANPLEAAIREVKEETGITDFKCVNATIDTLTPLDIDIHAIGYNGRLNLPSHTHFDFRYLFVIENIEDVRIDEEELDNYKWVDIDYLKNNTHLGSIIEKIEKVIENV